MYNVEFNEWVIINIDTYIYHYKKYFIDLYSDTGIFSEEIIIQKYIEEAKLRHREIFNIIQKRLHYDSVLWSTPSNTLRISWRSKTLLVAWQDEWNMRIVTECIIQ